MFVGLSYGCDVRCVVFVQLCLCSVQHCVCCAYSLTVVRVNCVL